MLFTSGEFLLIYLPVVLGGFFVVARWFGRPFAAAWLALASLFFYGYWRTEDVPLLVGSIAFNYLAGRHIQRCTATQARQRRLTLVFAVTVNLLVLAYFKYANFLLDSAAAMTGSRPAFVDVVLPIGISFFTFTQIAYLVDSHAGKVRERNPVHYALFVTYFPHLISGPVLHHAEMMPQFARAETYTPRLANAVLGMAFLFVGLFKKVVVADSAAPLSNDVFTAAATQALDAATAWQGVLAYTVQIYYDFSGYSDMAVGLSLLFGVRLPYNFDSPYKARSIIDFWRRWHMTLSRFLRDYLYVALGGNRRGNLRRYVNLALTMLLGGLWHGASWTFVVWGGLHGAYLMLNHGWRHLAASLAGRIPAWRSPLVQSVGHIAALALTLLAVMVAWVFFRATSVQDAFHILAAMAGAARPPAAATATPAVATALDPGAWALLLLAMLVALLAPNSQELIDGRLRPSLEAAPASVLRPWQGLAVGACIVLALLLAMVSASRDVSEFIYFNF